MNTQKLLGPLLIAVVLCGCVTSTPTSRPAVPPSSVSSPSANILVISAVYGSGTNFADVTYRVNDLIHQPTVEFFARPEWLKADPTPGWNKALVIVYELEGRRQVFTTGEGGWVDLEILQAPAR